MNEQPKPDWWPECPWPQSIMGASVKEARQMLRREFNEYQFDSITHVLMRHGWLAAEASILERLKERGIEL